MDVRQYPGVSVVPLPDGLDHGVPLPPRHHHGAVLQRPRLGPLVTACHHRQSTSTGNCFWNHAGKYLLQSFC